MKDYVLDSNAIILYLIGAADSAKTARLFRDVQDGSAHLAMSAVNWAECWHILIRQRSARQADAILNEIAAEVEIVPADREHAERAGHLRCRFSASLADCFAASLAMA